MYGPLAALFPWSPVYFMPTPGSREFRGRSAIRSRRAAHFNWPARAFGYTLKSPALDLLAEFEKFAILRSSAASGSDPARLCASFMPQKRGLQNMKFEGNSITSVKRYSHETRIRREKKILACNGLRNKAVFPRLGGERNFTCSLRMLQTWLSNDNTDFSV